MARKFFHMVKIKTQKKSHVVISFCTNSTLHYFSDHLTLELLREMIFAWTLCFSHVRDNVFVDQLLTTFSIPLLNLLIVFAM